MKTKAILSVLVLSNLLLLCTLFVKSSYSAKNMDMSQNITISRGKENHASDKFLSLRVENEGLPINKTVHLLDTNSTRFTMEDIVGKKNHNLVFVRYSSRDCSSCIDKITKIVEKFPIEKRDKVVFVSDNASLRSFIVREVQKKSNIVSYTFDPEDDRSVTGIFLGIPLEGKGMPFCFTVNGHYETDNFYIPDVDNEQAIQEYLTAVLNKIGGRS